MMISPSLRHLFIVCVMLVLPITSMASPADDKGDAEEPTSVEYPGTPYQQLPQALQGKFRSLAKSELCPCDESVESLHLCLQEEDACAVARAGAFAAMRALYLGKSETQARKKMVEQIEIYQQTHDFRSIATQRKGPSDATVTLVEFADFECPHCKHASQLLSDIYAEYSDTLAIEFRHFPISNHRHAEQAAKAAVAAGQQGEFWEFHDKLFAQQRQLHATLEPTALFHDIAKELGLDIEQFQKDLEAPESHRKVAQQKQKGLDIGVTGTPTLFINGRIYLGPLQKEAIIAAIEQAIHKE